jgi:glycine cleavage system T protein
MWRSPLHGDLAAAGARFGPYGDCEVAATFGDDIAGEYQAVRTAAGLIDVSYRCKVRVTGGDRVTFLQGMLSNDVVRLQPGQGCHAAFLTVQGKVVADLRVYAFAEHLLLDVEPAGAPGLLQGLERHLVADDVELSDVSAELAALSIQGPRADQVVAAAVDGVADLDLERDLDFGEGMAAAARVVVARVREAGEIGYELFVPVTDAAAVWHRVLDCGRPFGLRPVGHAAFNVLRVEAGIPWYGTDIDESRLVLEAALESAVSTTKGCYLGQEVVERASARGHVNRRLVGLRVLRGGVPRKGAIVQVEGKEIGTVTSAVASPALGRPIALAYVRREHLTPGEQVSVVAEGEPAVAQVTPLPFIGR